MKLSIKLKIVIEDVRAQHLNIMNAKAHNIAFPSPRCSHTEGKVSKPLYR
jgi:hypothetical protein